MPSLKRDEVEAGLSKRGFIEETGKDHRYFRLLHDGKATGIYTKTSRGTGYKALGDGLVFQHGEAVEAPDQGVRAAVIRSDDPVPGVAIDLFPRAAAIG